VGGWVGDDMDDGDENDQDGGRGTIKVLMSWTIICLLA
jgi:hypothetical protein